MVSVSDNGQGFDVEAARNKGKGLKSLQKRMKKVNGKINWHSSPEDGTRVSIVVPLPKSVKL
ncbi:MAG: ATP-binding protein, partial [Bacteroidota bacterium]